MGMPFTVFIMVYITNAINLIDGIDGLASGLCCIALSVLSVIFFLRGQYVYALLESDHHVRVGQCRRDLVRHAHVNDQETDHVAQRKAAGIPHEKLMSTVGVTEHVVAPKGHKDTQRTDRQQGVNRWAT